MYLRGMNNFKDNSLKLNTAPAGFNISNIADNKADKSSTGNPVEIIKSLFSDLNSLNAVNPYGLEFRNSSPVNYNGVLEGNKNKKQQSDLDLSFLMNLMQLFATLFSGSKTNQEPDLNINNSQSNNFKNSLPDNQFSNLFNSTVTDGLSSGNNLKYDNSIRPLPPSEAPDKTTKPGIKSVITDATKNNNTKAPETNLKGDKKPDIKSVITDATKNNDTKAKDRNLKTDEKPVINAPEPGVKTEEVPDTEVNTNNLNNLPQTNQRGLDIVNDAEGSINGIPNDCLAEVAPVLRAHGIEVGKNLWVASAAAEGLAMDPNVVEILGIENEEQLIEALEKQLIPEGTIFVWDGKHNGGTGHISVLSYGENGKPIELGDIVRDQLTHIGSGANSSSFRLFSPLDYGETAPPGTTVDINNSASSGSTGNSNVASGNISDNSGNSSDGGNNTSSTGGNSSPPPATPPPPPPPPAAK